MLAVDKPSIYSTNRAKKWSVFITDISNHGPSGMPKEVVFRVMKYALEIRLQISREHIRISPMPCDVRLEFNPEGGAVLTLDVSLGGCEGTFIPFTFVLSPVMDKPVVDTPADYSVVMGRLQNAVSVVERSLYAAEDKILELQSKLNRQLDVITLRFSAATKTSGTIILWNKDKIVNSNKQLFHTHDGLNSSVLVKVAGLYQINIQMTTTGSTGSGVLLKTNDLMLQSNHSSTIQSIQGSITTYLYCFVINHIMSLDSNSWIAVENGTMGSATECYMTIQKL
jgi:hypothetical protein